MVFDEAYYVPASKDLLALVPSNLEHPFFGKIWGALGIYLFGSDFFGWRIFYVLIGVARRMGNVRVALVFFSKEKALLAASLLAFETLFFIHTSLLLLEGPPILFALLGFLGYFKKHYYLAAILLWVEHSQQRMGNLFCFCLVPVPRLGDKAREVRQTIFRKISENSAGVCSSCSSRGRSTFANLRHCIPSVQKYDHYTGHCLRREQHQSRDCHHDKHYHNSQRFCELFLGEFYLLLHLPHGAYSIQFGCSKSLGPYCVVTGSFCNKINPSQYYVTTVTVTTTSSNGTVLSKTFLHPIDWQGIGNLVIWWSIWIIVPVIIFKAIRRQATQLDALIAALLIWYLRPQSHTLFSAHKAGRLRLLLH